MVIVNSNSTYPTNNLANNTHMLPLQLPPLQSVTSNPLKYQYPNNINDHQYQNIHQHHPLLPSLFPNESIISRSNCDVLLLNHPTQKQYTHLQRSSCPSLPSLNLVLNRIQSNSTSLLPLPSTSPTPTPTPIPTPHSAASLSSMSASAAPVSRMIAKNYSDVAINGSQRNNSITSLSSSNSSTNNTLNPTNINPSINTNTNTNTNINTNGNEFLTSPTARKYRCKICDKGFTTSGHLARHHRIHTGVKNHICPFEGCNSRFSRQDNCMQHYKTHLKSKNGRKKFRV